MSARERLRMFLLAIVLAVLLNEATAAVGVTCYYRNWSQYGKGSAKFLPKDIDPRLCSVIKYGSLRINMANNTLETIKPNDDELIAAVNALKTVNPSLKVVIAVGGWSHEFEPRYSRMAATPETRTIFINSVVAFLKKHRVDGLSYNWIFPGKRPEGVPDSDKEKFTLLLRETKAAFQKVADETNSERYHLSATVSPNEDQMYKSYELPDIGNYVDSVDVMVTSLWGYWKRRTGTNTAMKGNKVNIIKSIEAWVNSGMSSSKIHIGFALYGRTYNLINPANYGLGERTNGPGRAGPHTRKKGILAYYEICSREWDHETKWYDSETKTAYASDTQGLWVAFDDAASLKYKILYLMQKYKLGGVTLWALAFDDFTGAFCDGGKFPLVRGVVDAMKEATTPVVEPVQTCKVAVNLGFILDSSGSLKYGYQKEKNFLKAIASSFGISKDGTRAGVITFSYFAELSIKLNDNFDIYSFNAAVDGIPLMGYTTRIDRALRLAQRELFTEENGAISGQPNVLVLLTDGSQSGGADVEEPGGVADELRDEGIIIIAVGIGRSVDKHELQHIGGGVNHTFIAPTFKGLLQSNIITIVKETSCPSDMRDTTGTAIVPTGGLKTKADIAFIIDASGSVGRNFAEEKEFVKAIASYCGVSKNGSRAGVITYSRKSRQNIKLIDHFNLKSFSSAVDKIPFMGFWSRIDIALRLAQSRGFTPNNGGREDVQNVVVFMTDGFQRVYGAEHTGEVASELRLNGIKTIAIGIKLDDEVINELDQISGNSEHTFMVKSFYALLEPEFVTKVGRAVCTEYHEHRG